MLVGDTRIIFVRLDEGFYVGKAVRLSETADGDLLSVVGGSGGGCGVVVFDGGVDV